MLSILRKLLRRQSTTPAPDGGTEVGAVSIDEPGRGGSALRERYDVDAVHLDPELPEEANDHLGSLFEDQGPSTESYVPAYQDAAISPSEFVAAHRAAVDGASMRRSTNSAKRGRRGCDCPC